MLFAIYLKNKNSVLGLFVILFASFLLFFILAMFIVYLRINILHPHIEINSTVIYLRLIILNYTFLFTLYFIKRVYELKYPVLEKGILLFTVIIGISTIIVLQSGMNPVYKTGIIIAERVVYRLLLAVVIIIITIISRHKVQIQDNYIYKLLKGQLIFYMAYSLFFVAFILLKYLRIITFPYFEAFIIPTVFIAWNALNIRYVIVFNISKNIEHKAIPEKFIDNFRITPREEEIILLIGEGLSNKEIASRLEISPNTVKVYIYNIFQKTGASSRIGLLKMLKQRL